MKELLISQFFPPNIGGIEQYYYQFWQERQNLTVLTKTGNFHYDENYSGIKNSSDHEITRVKFFNKIIWPHWLPLLWQAYIYIKKNKYTKIYVGEILPVGTVVWLLTRFIKVSYIVFSHGMDVRTFKRSGRKRWLVKKIIKEA